MLAHVLLAVAPTDADNGRAIFDDTRKLIVVPLRGIRGFIDDDFSQVGIHAQQHFDVQFHFDRTRARLSVEAVERHILQRDVTAAEALRIRLDIAL